MSKNSIHSPIQVPLLGSSPCFINLQDILIELDDKRISHLVCRILDDAYRFLGEIPEISSSHFRQFVANCYYAAIKNKVLQYKFPIKVESHLLACLTCLKRDVIRHGYTDNRNRRRDRSRRNSQTIQ